MRNSGPHQSTSRPTPQAAVAKRTVSNLRFDSAVPWVASNRLPGSGGPSGPPERRETKQLVPSDDQKHGEEPRGPSGGGLSEDRGKARPDEQSRKDPSATPHSQPSTPGHTPATTVPSSQQERKPSSVPHRLLAPSEHAHTMTELSSQYDRNDPSVTPHMPSVLPELTSATTKPLSLQGHEDPSEPTPHRLPSTPDNHTATVPKSDTQPLSVSVPQVSEGSTSYEKERKRGCWTRFKRWCADCWRWCADHCCCCCCCCWKEVSGPV